MLILKMALYYIDINSNDICLYLLDSILYTVLHICFYYMILLYKYVALLYIYKFNMEFIFKFYFKNLL